jgi:hypothetical protein
MLNNLIVVGQVGALPQITSSPLEQFETTNFISFTAPILGDFVLSLTNVGLYSIIVLALGIGYHALASNTQPLRFHNDGVSARIVPSK